jgi:Peptidase family M1 domain
MKICSFSQPLKCALPFLVGVVLLLNSGPIQAQDTATANGQGLYDAIKAFSLTGGSAEAKSVVLKRDRVVMTFDGTFYFGAPVAGHVNGAVFIGQGRFRADVPPSEYEKNNLKRQIGAEMLESDFKTAVLRFSDDTFDYIGKGRQEGERVFEPAQKLATEMGTRVLKETGANLAARVALSILNKEEPGFFFGNFDGGNRGRFNFLLDYQGRMPVASFDINGGEKGLIFVHKSVEDFNEVWLAFYGLEDYQRGQVQYSDTNDLINIFTYKLDVDLRDHKKALSLLAKVNAQIRLPNVRAVSFRIGESLSEIENVRLKKQMRLKSVTVNGLSAPAVQEDWEGGFMVFLPAPAQVGQYLNFEFSMAGDFMYDAPNLESHYPRSNETWYPRHGYLDRATYDLTYRHPKDLRIASVGVRLSEELDAEQKDVMITRYKMGYPVALVTFALAPFERHTEMVKWDKGGDPMPLEFSSLPGSYAEIKENFIMAEMNNSVRYFSALFGKYPYPTFGGAFHPFNFGQGFPTLLMIPAADRSRAVVYKFIGHETAHQWWGNIVAWRSYRDQWLSEGFAEYSGVIYTGLRDGVGSREDLLSGLRNSLKAPVETTEGLKKGKLYNVGPIILGHRLFTLKTANAYQGLIYNKGALVLRMLHFLLSDPVTSDDKGFFMMMTDFVSRYRDKAASSDDFRAVANEHFARSPIAQEYGLKDLNWFFKEWVYETGYPSYELQYQFQDEPDGKVLVTGTVKQENVPDGWFMVLPIVFSFGEKQEGSATVQALGPSTPFKLRLPMRPKKIELDPRHWIISEKTSTKGG